MRKFGLLVVLAVIAVSAAIGYRAMVLQKDPAVLVSATDSVGELNLQPWYSDAPASLEVKGLMAQLKHSDPLERYRAADALRSKGAEAEPAVDILVALLDDESKVTSEQIYRDPRMSARWDTCPGEAAALALAAIGEPAVKQLAHAVSEGSTASRKHAAKSLAVSTSESAITALKEVSKDEDPEVRATALAALGKMVDHRIQPLQAALRDPDPKVRRSAVEALHCIGSQSGSANVTAALISVFKDKDAEVRAASARAFALMPVAPYSGQAEMPLLGLLHDADPSVRRQAVLAVGHQQIWQGMEPLIRRLSDSDPKVRTATAYALNELTGKNFGEDPTRWRKWWYARYSNKND